MTRALPYLNLAGVLALLILSGFQWEANRGLNLQYNELEKARLALEAKLAESEKNLKGSQADLEIFRQQISQADTTAKESESKLTALSTEGKQTAQERDQLKTSVAQWTAAATARDEQLKKANEELHKLAAERNEAVSKYNDLALKHNEVVKDLNALRAKAGGKKAE